MVGVVVGDGRGRVEWDRGGGKGGGEREGWGYTVDVVVLQ